MSEKELTWEEYIDKGLLEAEIEAKTTTKRYTMEESFAISEKLIDDYIASMEDKRCIS
ncbi:MAG: hypothetical protein FWG45_01535 [Oscillospiraceae bacterium]|nr:hypothetical protein [Oscillospiraceae bacterium]